ncbi:MAG: hypothetical protein ACSHX7_02590 [Luteolibacter sp.]
MAKDGEKAEKKGGCFGKLVGLFVFLLVAGLGVSAFFVSQPQDLTDVEGNSTVTAVPVSPQRDLSEVLKKSLSGRYTVTLQEKEINEWLAREVELKQGGELGRFVTLKKVLVRLETGVAEVIIVREIAGRDFTTSMFLQVQKKQVDSEIATSVELHGGSFHEAVPVPPRGGRFGQLTVPQGFLRLVLDDFSKLAEVLDEEVKIGFKTMADLKIEEGRLVLDPSSPADKEREKSF